MKNKMSLRGILMIFLILLLLLSSLHSISFAVNNEYEDNYTSEEYDDDDDDDDDEYVDEHPGAFVPRPNNDLNRPFEVDDEKVSDAIGEFKDTMNTISNIFLAISAVSSVLIFIIHFIRLASSYNHPMIRHKVIVDIMISGICTAGIGAFGLFFKLYIGIFM